jgi:hypothetical protein
VSEDLSREEVAQRVDRAVAQLLAEAGVAKPPVDAVALGRDHLGLNLDEARRPRGRKSGLPRPEPTEERWQWEAAAAIGQHLKPALLRALGIDPDERRPMMGVSLANLFAERLLAPTRWFAADAAACGYDLAELQQRYRTAGCELLAWRLLDLAEPCIITVLDNDSISRRRSNAWRVKKELAPAEKQCQRYVSEHARPHEIRAGGWTVQGWPVYCVSGKRQILRSVVDEDALLTPD